MSKVFAYYCDCSTYGYRVGHRAGCALHARLLIKEKVCELMNVGHVVSGHLCEAMS